MDKRDREEKQLIEWERVAARQIKNTFADIKEIKFDKESVKFDRATGYINVDVIIVTKNEKGDLSISLPTNKEHKTLPSYIGIDTKEGITQDKVKVIYTSGKDEEI